MELYLDSANLTEIKEAFDLGFLTGLTTTPTFMHRHGIRDVDGMILKLAKMVPILQIEALGETADEIVTEAKRQNDLGLDKNKTVYKIPISLQGVKACKQLRDLGFLVNIHLIYTLQQAYMAMEAGANYICPLIGRLQDQGTDALQMIEQVVDAVNYYDYDTKVMFSSVRNAEHVRNALAIGVNAVTVPWKVMRQLTDNHFTELGTQQFFEHTRLMSLTVGDVISKKNPVLTKTVSIAECIIKMSSEGFGAVTIVDEHNKAVGIFTDGDLRRLINSKKSTNILQEQICNLTLNKPKSIDSKTLLVDAQNLMKEVQVDQLVVEEAGLVIGMLDIQDIIK